MRILTLRSQISGLRGPRFKFTPTHTIWLLFSVWFPMLTHSFLISTSGMSYLPKPYWFCLYHPPGGSRFRLSGHCWDVTALFSEQHMTYCLRLRIYNHEAATASVTEGSAVAPLCITFYPMVPVSAETSPRTNTLKNF